MHLTLLKDPFKIITCHSNSIHFEMINKNTFFKSFVKLIHIEWQMLNKLMILKIHVTQSITGVSNVTSQQLGDIIGHETYNIVKVCSKNTNLQKFGPLQSESGLFNILWYSNYL